MKMRLGALRTTENESVSAKHDKLDPTPPVPPKSGPGAQNMKTEPGALGTAQNESGNAKQENGI
jgi:hypothetical protein